MKQTTTLGMTEWLLLFALGIIWGGSFFFAKVAVLEVPPFTLVFYRVSVAALILITYLKVTGRDFPVGWQIWSAFLVMGLINNVIPFSLLFWGQVHIASGLASILNATTPIFTVVVAHLLTSDERINWHRLIGVLLGFSGVAVMLGSGLSGEVSNPPLPMIACLVAAISYAFAGVFGRRFSKMGVGPVRVAMGQLSASSLIMLPAVLLLDPTMQPTAYSWPVLWSVLGLAVVCTALAYIIFFRILAAGGATNLSLVTLIVPASAILLGTAFLDEVLGLYEFLGLGLIALGLVATDGRLLRRFRRS